MTPASTPAGTAGPPSGTVAAAGTTAIPGPLTLGPGGAVRCPSRVAPPRAELPQDCRNHCGPEDGDEVVDDEVPHLRQRATHGSVGPAGVSHHCHT